VLSLIAHNLGDENFRSLDSTVVEGELMLMGLVKGIQLVRKRIHHPVRLAPAGS